MKLIGTTAVLVAACLASACGGGGDGGTPAATPAVLSAANQRVAAQETLSTSFAPILGGQTLTGVQSMGESAIVNLARDQLDKLGTYLAGAKTSGTLTAVAPNQTVPCTPQGSLTVTVADTDKNGVVSVGDTVTIVSNACQVPEGLLSGSLSFTINSLSGGVFGSDNYSASVKLTFGAFTVAGTQFSASVNGDLTLSVTATGVNSVVSTFSTPSLKLTGTYANETRTRLLTNFQATATQVPDSNHSYRTSYTSSGTLSSSALASHPVSFTTPTPFLRYGIDVYPSSGEMMIVGGSSTRLKLVGSALTGAYLVGVSLDTGNGVLADIDLVRWSDLM